MKQCSKCKTEKPLDQFSAASVQAGYRDGKYPWCKACASAYGKAYYAANKERVAARHRLTKYGITQDEYVAMCLSQDQRCLVCSREVQLVVDHDHQTTKIRGLLCRECNASLGLLAEDPERITALADYARQHQTEEVMTK